MNTQAIILAAGKGVRMGLLETPKVLVPLSGKPLISYLTNEVKKLHFNLPTIVVVGYKYDQIQKVLGPDYDYAFQQGLLGTGHAVKAAIGRIKAPNVIVLYGDVPFLKSESITKLINLHEDRKSSLSMFTAFVPNFENEYLTFKGFGRIIRNENNEITKIAEFIDATKDQQEIREVNPGIYVFNTEWLKSNIDRLSTKNKKNEFYLTDMIEIAIKQNIPVTTSDIGPMEVMGVNTIFDLKTAESKVIEIVS